MKNTGKPSSIKMANARNRNIGERIIIRNKAKSLLIICIKSIMPLK